MMNPTDAKTEAASLAELAVEAAEIADRIAEEATARSARRGFAFSCRKGCGACCRYLVRVSIPEAFFLHERWLKLEPERRAAYEGRIGEIEARLGEEGVLALLQDGAIAGGDGATMSPRLHELSRQYLALGMACPFLEEESCSIHPWRPLACRQYHVVTPAELCVDPFNLNVCRVPMPVHATEALAEAAAELLGEPPAFIPLPLAIGWAERHPELAARSWPRDQALAALRRRMKIE